MRQPVRCPFCALGQEFRPMVKHPDGRYICTKCSHTSRPGDVHHACPCAKCFLMYERLAAAGELKPPSRAASRQELPVAFLRCP